MKFDNQVYEKLIELVRNRPPIYNCRLAEHKDVQLQKNLWKAIADQMEVEGMTGEDWKKLWKQKRDFYVKKRKELMSAKSGAAAKVINKGPLHDQMLFLNDFIAATSTVSNLENSMQASQDLFVEIETQIEPTVVEAQMPQPSPSPSSRSLTPSTIDSAIPPTTEYGSGKSTQTQRAIKRKSEVSSSASNVAQAIEQASARSASNFASLREMFQSVDQDVDFYMFLSKKTKSFSSETQEWMEDEVMKVYMEAKRRDRETAQHLNGPNYRSYDNVMYYTGISDDQMTMPSTSTYNQV